MTTLARVFEKPPRLVVKRALGELRVELDRVLAPRRPRQLDERRLNATLGAASIDGLWERILAAPYPFVRTDEELARIERRWPDERPRVLEAAEAAVRRELDLLGSGPFTLRSPADWHRDPKSGKTWPLGYGRRLTVVELDRPGDVKLPWEISRLHWLLPAARAYRLTRDERFAAAIRATLEDWMAANPHGRGVNWALAMEPALRIFTWTYLLHTCGRSEAWRDAGFRFTFLRALYLHVEFVTRNLERSDVNGNHFVADAAGIAVGGLVLGVPRWADAGWAMLDAELPRQVHPDGVDFEASASYHRLVGELAALAALLRRAHGQEVAPTTLQRLRAMAEFTRAYTGPDGCAPLWGDADDGRALPLGGDANDHRSLPVLVAALDGAAAAGNTEGAWLVGPDHVEVTQPEPGSAAFRDGGVYVLRGPGDHVFIDCGDVGLAGRGGHGHNDCLSFEATLAGHRLVSDSGTYVYTESPQWRNAFRATAAHNTPCVDQVEQGKLDPRDLWRLGNEAQPDVRFIDDKKWVGSHSGYRRLAEPVTPIRTIELDPVRHALVISDEFDGTGEHLVEVPLHLDPSVSVERTDDAVCLVAAETRFPVEWSGEWELVVEPAWIAPRYGVRLEATRLRWWRQGPLRPLRVEIAMLA